MASCRHHCIALHCIALTFLASGCMRAPSPEPDLSAILGDRARGAEPTGSSVQEHDFGVILAQGQTLQHEFAFKNPTARPIRLIRGRAFTPCCSSIGPLPESIPPKGEAKIPVTIKPGYQSGLKGVGFAVETDAREHPAHNFFLRARLVSTWEMEQLEGSSTSLPLGHSGTQTFRMTARRKGNQGLSLPEKLSSTPPLVVAWGGEASTKSGAGGLIEATREITVTIPAEKQAGARRGEIAFGWPDGQTEMRTIRWEVRPRLRVSPSGLVLRSSVQPVQQTITVISDGRPFQVERVMSPLLVGSVELPRLEETRQTLILKLDVSRAPAEGAVDIEIRTDHPDQPTVSLTILVLRERKGTES